MLGPLGVVLALLVAHGLASVPKSPMLRQREKGRAGAPSETAKGRGREAAAFAKERPDPGFDATHRPALEHAVQLARTLIDTRDGQATADEAAFDAALECRRWRCQVKLCGARKRVRAVHRVLRKMELEDDVLFDAYELQKPSSKAKKKTQRVCITSTVRFSRPAPELKGIRVAKASKEPPKKKNKKRKKKPKANASPEAAGSTGTAAPKD